MMQPFDPNRRIILMLHGLASSPEAWVNVANDIQGDEVLRQHFQVWQVYYPTNVPILVNLARIRRATQQTLAHFDPDGTVPASHGMVLIGHSMGGVLARLLVSTSGDALWATFEDKYVPEGTDIDREDERLDRLLNFTPMPQIERAIFIAAPIEARLREQPAVALGGQPRASAACPAERDRESDADGDEHRTAGTDLPCA
ncbi:pimeloyl-ACP methyl ester carboxylesterase [Paraburkholderia sp. 32]